MEFFYRTDLACEALSGESELPRGIVYESFTDETGIKTERMYIPKYLEKKLGKSEGNYITINCGKLHELDRFELEALSSLLSVELVRLAKLSLGFPPDSRSGVLVAGLGNSSMTPDSVGPDAVEQLIATRHLTELDPALYKKIGCCAVSAISPGVLGQTGIESSELIKAAVTCARPDLVVAIDALAARSLERLGATVQLCDTGIRPGSGIGNKRKELSRETLGVPVIVIGIPTVMDSSTLIYDTVSRGGKEKISEELRSILENGRSFFVAPKDCDEIVKCAARVISSALNSSFGII